MLNRELSANVALQMLNNANQMSDSDSMIEAGHSGSMVGAGIRHQKPPLIPVAKEVKLLENYDFDPSSEEEKKASSPSSPKMQMASSQNGVGDG